MLMGIKGSFSRHVVAIFSHTPNDNHSSYPLNLEVTEGESSLPSELSLREAVEFASYLKRLLIFIFLLFSIYLPSSDGYLRMTNE